MSGRETSGGGTHGSLWGHEQCDKTFKGRYEPQTGRLSIVKPCGSEHRPVPDVILNALNNKFKNIQEIVEF